MAGAMNKANQRQAQKSKSGKRYGFKRIRIHEIPLQCAECGESMTVASAQAYSKGGNRCKCGSKYRFNVPAFPKAQVVKI